MKRKSILLFALFALFAMIIGCDDAVTEKDQKGRLMAAMPAQPPAEPPVNPDTLFNMKQFVIERSEAERREDVFIEKYRTIISGVKKNAFKKNDIELDIKIDSLLAFDRYFPACGNNQIKGVRIAYGMDGNRPEFYFAPVIMTLDSIVSKKLFFSISDPVDYYFFTDSWMQASQSEMNEHTTNYATNIFKKDTNGKFNNLVIVNNEQSDPSAVTFPWVEITTLIDHNVLYIVKEIARQNSEWFNKNVSDKSIIDRWENYSYKELRQNLPLQTIPGASSITFQSGAENISGVLKHIVTLVPDLNSVSQMRIDQSKLFQLKAANFNTPCPHNCGIATYEHK